MSQSQFLISPNGGEPLNLLRWKCIPGKQLSVYNYHYNNYKNQSICFILLLSCPPGLSSSYIPLFYSSDLPLFVINVIILKSVSQSHCRALRRHGPEAQGCIVSCPRDMRFYTHRYIPAMVQGNQDTWLSTYVSAVNVFVNGVFILILLWSFSCQLSAQLHNLAIDLPTPNAYSYLFYVLKDTFSSSFSLLCS